MVLPSMMLWSSWWRGSSPKMQSLMEGSPAFGTPAGQSTNCAKWYRNAAFTWYSSALDWAQADCDIPENSTTVQRNANIRADIQLRTEIIFFVELFPVRDRELIRSEGPGVSGVGGPPHQTRLHRGIGAGVLRVKVLQEILAHHTQR